MKKIVPLTKIGFFNPGRLSDSEIELAFIARRAFFDYILKKVIAETPNSIPQHHLIIGQRGMGKSSLLMRIAAELRKESYNSDFIPLSFPEEQYNVDRLSKFWLNCLDALADSLDKEKKVSLLSDLDVEIERLSKQRGLSNEEAYQTFITWSNKTERRIVLLVDNLNLILSKISIEEQHALRAILISEGAPILIGTSAAAIVETLDYGMPFYDAFAINYLKKLDFEESLEVLLNLAKITGNDDAIDRLYAHRGRLEAIYQLTGGTPRTLTILFPLIQDGFSEEIQSDLDALLDLITPLYKARFEELPNQQQIILDAVALNWDPVNLKDLRDITLLENAKLSPQLNRLIDLGWLQKVKTSRKGGDSYEVSERFFNVWYLMRRSSRRQKRELYCLTKFLEAFYGTELKDIAKFRVTCEVASLDNIALNLALADAVGEMELSDLLRTKSYDELLRLGIDDGRVLRDFFIPAHVTEKKIEELLNEGLNYLKSNQRELARECMYMLIKLDTESVPGWYNLGMIEYAFSNYSAALDAYKRVIELDNSLASAYSGMAMALARLGRIEDAEAALDTALKVDSENAKLWFDIGVFKSEIKFNYREAEDAFKKVLELNTGSLAALRKLAKIYHNQYYDFDAAATIYLEILKKKKDDVGTLFNLYVLYDRDKEDSKKALKYLQRAIKIKPENPNFWNALGSFEVWSNSNYKAAEKAYLKALELDPNYAEAWSGLGDTYRRGLKDYSKAETAYLKAIELDPNDSRHICNLGMLMRNLGKYDEAERCFSKAIELDGNDEVAANNLAWIYNDVKNDPIRAERILLNFISKDPKSTNSWFNIGAIRYSQRDIDGAILAYQQMISIKPDEAGGYFSLGVCYYEKGDFVKSEEYLVKGTDLDPSQSKYWRLLAQVYRTRNKKFSEAEIAFKHCLELDQEDLHAYFGLAGLYFDNALPASEAIAAYKKAIELKPNFHEAWVNLSRVLAQEPDGLTEAEQAILKAIEIDGRDEECWIDLGLIYYQQQKYLEAAAAFEKSIEIEPNTLAQNNLVFILRDHLNDIDKALTVYNKMEASDPMRDAYYLNGALFAYYSKNIGDAEKLIAEALHETEDKLKEETADDWYHSIAVIYKLGYIDSLLGVMKERGFDIILRPLYVAIGALVSDSVKMYLNNVAAEIREPASILLSNINEQM